MDKEIFMKIAIVFDVVCALMSYLANNVNGIILNSFMAIILAILSKQK